MLGGVLLAGAALRLHALGDKCLWGDEIGQVYWAQNDVAWIYRTALPHSYGALDVYLTHAMLAIGSSEFVLRFPATWLGVLSVALTYGLGRRMFGPATGVVASLLLAAAAYHVRYSQEVRAYSLLVCAALLSLWFFWSVLDRGGWLLATVSGLYAHLSMVFVVVAEAGTAGIAWLRGRRARTGTEPGRAASWAGRLLLGSVLAIVLWLPDIVPALDHVAGRLKAETGPRGMGAISTDGSVSWAPDGPIQALQAVAVQLGTEITGSATNAWVYVTLGAVGAVAGWLTHRRTAVVLALFLLIVPLGSAPFRSALTPRYFIFMLPPLLLLAAHGVEALGRGVALCARRLGLGRTSVIYGSVVALSAALLLVLSLAPLSATYAEVRQNWREAAILLRHHLQPGDVAAGLGWAAMNVKYYAPELDVEHITDESAADLERLLAAGSRWWYIRDPGLASGRPDLEAWIRGHALVTIQLGGVVVSTYQPDADADSGAYSRLLEEAAELFPAAGTYLNLGDLAVEQEQPERAISYYQEAAGLEPTWAVAHTRLGTAYRALGRLEEAKAAYLRSIEVDPTYVGAYLNLGWIHDREGREQEGLGLYRKAVEIAPESAWAQSTLGSAYWRQGKRAGGLAHLEQAAELEPNNVSWLFPLADAYRDLERKEEAVAIYERILTLAPGHPRATEALEALGR